MKIYSDGKVVDLEIDDKSYRYRKIMGEHAITMYFSLDEFIEIPVGSYCVYPELSAGEKIENLINSDRIYTLEDPASFKKNGKNRYEYTLIFESHAAKLRRWKFRNTEDNRLKFSLTARPQEHIEMLVKNLNRRDSGWTVGTCLEGVETLVSYNHSSLDAALQAISDAFNTEWEIKDKVVSLGKVEYFKDNPLPLSYGRGNGFIPGVGRENYDQGKPVDILFAQGGERNIDFSKYGNKELLLPKNQQLGYDGTRFNYETGFVSKGARWYRSDSYGYSISRSDIQSKTSNEDSLDCSQYYPSREGTVNRVEHHVANDFWDILDDHPATGIPESLDFNKYIIEGHTLSILFQSGMLAGKEFDVTYQRKDRRFLIKPQEIDGYTMPTQDFIPRVGDKYIVLGCMLPNEYICDNATRTGASWDMFRQCVKHLYENEEPRFTFTGELSSTFVKADWENLGGRLIQGGYIDFTDEKFFPPDEDGHGFLIRIIGIKDLLCKPHSPTIELSNLTLGGSVVSELKKIEDNEVKVEDMHKTANQYTRRLHRDSKETIQMLSAAMLENFDNSINPIAVETMLLLLGDESLQFKFVNNTTNPTPVDHHVTFEDASQKLTVPGGIIQHMTLGINTISSEHSPSEYKFWTIPTLVSGELDPETKYYLYAKVSRTVATGEFRVLSEPIALEGEDGFYHLLMGVLNSAYDGERSYASLYGFTEILPGQIRTDKIISTDGKTYFDLILGEIGGNITFLSTDGEAKYVKDVEMLADAKGRIFRNTPTTPYQVGDLWLNGVNIYQCKVAKTGKQSFALSDWEIPVKYDHTETVINGGLVTTGTIEIKGAGGLTYAGITGVGSAVTSVRLWAGATYANRNSAPFRVLQNGKLIGTDVELTGIINAVSGILSNVTVQSGTSGNRVVLSSDRRSIRMIGNFYERDWTVGEWNFNESTSQISMRIYHVDGVTAGSVILSPATDGLYLNWQSRTGYTKARRFQVAGYTEQDLLVTMAGLPTSPNGLRSGRVWQDGTILRIVP